MNQNRTILHIDFDSFFASVAQQDDPNLRGKPVGIVANNGRTAIIAASREAKRRGVRSPTRSFEAQQICPDIRLVKANFIRYLDVSKQFLKIADEFSPVVELFSIDEVFMDVTDTLKLFGTIAQLTAKLKQKLAETVGPYITVSVGASYNKMLAKLASGTHKPNGLFILNEENRRETYRQCKLTDICGIGSRTEKHLNRIGVYELLDLETIALEKLIAEFGPVEGHFLKQVGLGIDQSEVIPYAKRQGVKSIGRQYCLEKNTYNKHLIDQTVYELCEEVGKKLRKLKKTARTVGFSLHGDCLWQKNFTFVPFCESGREIYAFYESQTDRFAHLQYARRISVWVGNLYEKSATPLSLFEDSTKWDTIYRTMDTINERFGNGALRNGFVYKSDLLTTLPNGFMADKWERETLAQTANVG